MEALELQEAQEGGSGLVGREGRFRATLLVQAGHGGRGDHLGPTSLAIAGRCQALASWSTSWTGRWRSVAAAEARPGYGRQDLLLVVHRTTAVGLDRGRVVRRDHQGVDVGVRDRQAEVVADEPPALGAGILVAGARVLRDAVHLLARLLRIPGELRDPRVRADRDRAGTGVLEGLQRGVDAEVIPSLVGGENAGVTGAGLPAVIEGDRDCPARDRVDVVVDRDRSRPGAPAVDRLRNRTSICRHPAAHLLRYYGRATGGRSGWERATGSPAAAAGP